MTVTATVSPARCPRSARSSAKSASSTSPSTTLPSWSTAMHPVGVTVEGEAEVRPGRHDRPRELARVGRAALVVDVAPSGASCSAVTCAPSVGQHSRRDGAGGAVGAVDDDAQPVEAARPPASPPAAPRRAPPPRGRRVMTPHPVAGRAAGRAGPGRPGWSRARARSSPSTSMGSFVPRRLKSLMPLSPKGLCEAEITAPGAVAGLGHARRPRGSAARRGRRRRRPPRPARRRRRPAGAARAAGVAADEERRRGRTRTTARPRARASSGVSSSFATPRTPSVPKRVGAMAAATAWSTAAPCGPSSGRTSSTPSPARRA